MRKRHKFFGGRSCNREKMNDFFEQKRSVLENVPSDLPGNELLQSVRMPKRIISYLSKLYSPASFAFDVGLFLYKKQGSNL